MKKVFRVEDLDCANCAAKMEDGIRKIPGVISVNVSFLAQKITLEAEDAQMEQIVKEMVATCKKIEPDCTILL